jgi:ATP-binding cassette subfamily B (MDR/TAP) protein 1
VLILDEATSALDVLAAGMVRETVARLVFGDEKERVGSSPSASSDRLNEDGTAKSPGWLRARGRGVKGKEKRRQMTVIVITHAREMMSVASHIVVLDKGRVVEEGGYGELKRKRGGAFARMLRGEALE